MNSPCTLCTWHRKTGLINETPHAIYDSKILAKADRFWSTKTSRNTWPINPCQGRSFQVNDKPHAIYNSKSLPKQIISGQRKPHATYNSLPLPKQVVPDQRKRHAIYDAKISRNIWYSSLCQGTVPGQRIPHTIHDSNSLPKQDVSGERKIFTQHTIHTSFPKQVIPGKRKTSRNIKFNTPAKAGRFRSKKPHTTWDSNTPV